MAVKPRPEVPEHAQERAAGLVGRQWVVEEIERWLSEGSERFLVLVGEPGWGKTALSAWLAGAGPAPEDAQEAAALARVRDGWDAVHFCVARGQEGTIDPRPFAEQLAGQLLRRVDGFTDAVVESAAPEVRGDVSVVDNHGTVIGVKIESLVVHAPSAQAVYGLAVRKPLQELAKARPDLEVRILVDALDEAFVREGTSIVDLIAGSGDLPSGVRWVLTTRDDDRVLDQFGDGVKKVHFRKHAAAAGEDLRRYVSTRLADDARLGGVPAELADELVRRAGDNFLYAAWVLDEIAERKREPDDVEGLPSGLYGLYREFLDRLLPKEREKLKDAWLGTHEPFFGCLVVATPAAPAAMLPNWLEWSEATLNLHLEDVSQLIEHVSETPDEAGYRLYHRSIADFLAAKAYEEDDRRRTNRYYVEPERHHDRIASHYLQRIAGEWSRDWKRSDTYGLRQLVGHLRDRLGPGQDGRKLDELYEVALDHEFHAAQSERLGIHSTLADLRAALDTALTGSRGEDLVRALRCVAAFRGLVRGEGLSDAVFDRVRAGDIELALTKTTHYGVETRSAGWSGILRLYLAWEAAEEGQVDTAKRAVADTDRLRSPATSDLADALLARTAAALARVQGDERGWLAELGRTDADSLADRYAVAAGLGDADVQAIAEQVRPSVERLVSASAAGEADAVSSRAFAESSPELAAERVSMDPESRAELTWSLKDRLRQIAAWDAGQELITRAVTPMLANPYPRYRDIGLVALGVSVLGSPDREWVRRRLQAILRVGLDDEGVTFTFDLATVVRDAWQQRGGAAPRLDAYLARAGSTGDVWGTGLRAVSARAAACPNRDEALSLLRDASSAPTTYAGYGVTAVLGLIDRCHELAEPDRAAAAKWGATGDETLHQMAAAKALLVYDPVFRDERVELVRRHRAWEQEPAPDVAAAQRALADMGDADMRSAYLSHVSARSSSLPEPERTTRLKALVPMALFDSTTLDAVLGRLMGACAAGLEDAELEAIAELVADELTTGQPWTLGEWR